MISSAAFEWASLELRNELLEDIFSIDVVTLFGKLLGKKTCITKDRKILMGFSHLAMILLQYSLCCCSCFLVYDKSSNLPVSCRNVALGTSLEISSAATAVSTSPCPEQLGSSSCGCVSEMRRHHMQHSIARIAKLSTA